jgi:hypothetical protein
LGVGENKIKDKKLKIKNIDILKIFHRNFKKFLHSRLVGESVMEADYILMLQPYSVSILRLAEGLILQLFSVSIMSPVEGLRFKF